MSIINSQEIRDLQEEEFCLKNNLKKTLLRRNKIYILSDFYIPNDL